MKNIKNIFMVLPILMFVGCSEWTGGGDKHFIDGYLIPNEIFTSSAISDSGTIVENGYIKIYFERWHGISTGATITRWANFEAYSKKYGDTHYYRDKPVPHTVIADALTSISVVSDKDYDELHPAGTSLDDVAVLLALSPYKFIKNDYKFEKDKIPDWLYKYNDYFTRYGIYGFNLTCKYLNELTEEDMTLLETDQVRIIFPKNNPVIGEVHNLTITVVYKDKIFTTTARYRF